MTNNQDTRYKQYSNSKIQSPNRLWLLINWLLVIIWLLSLGNWLLAVPARALDNPEEKIAKIIEDLVIARHPEWVDSDIRVTFKYADEIFEGLRKLEGDVDFKVVEVYKEFKPVGNIILPIEVSSDGSTRKVFIRAKVEVFQKIVVASKYIKREEIIGEDDLTLEERDIAMLPPKYFEDSILVIDTEARTSIPKKSVIFEWMIKEIPLVHRGDEVSILVKGSNLLVKARGTALEDGYLDKKIKVKSKKSDKTVEGTLISSDEVEVTLK